MVDRKRSIDGVAPLIALSGAFESLYRKTLACRKFFYPTEGGPRTSLPCRGRWCYRCRRTQWGERFYPYAETLIEKEREEGTAFLVTLTTAPCKRAGLRGRVAEMLSDRRRVLNQMKTTAGRRGEEFDYFWKLEGAVSYRNQISLYRPHFHLVVFGEAAAEDLVRRWLHAHEHAQEGHQHVSRIEAVQADLAVGEDAPVTLCGLAGVLGYLAKGIVSPEMEPTDQDALYRAFHGKKVYGASAGMRRKETWTPGDADDPWPAELGAVEVRPGGVLDLVTGELITWHDPRLRPPGHL